MGWFRRGRGAGRATVDDRPARFIEAFGGADNIADVFACATRLRVRPVDPGRIDRAAVLALGATALITSGTYRHAIVGTEAGQIADEMQDLLRDRPPAPGSLS